MEEIEASEDGISELPEPIIHHIFSFLQPKESREPGYHMFSFLQPKELREASLLCKAWLSAWRTRPDLHFIFNCRRRSSVLDFMNGINTTLLRYHENKISIDSLMLRFYSFSVEPEHVNRWLQIAVESGVKRLNLLIKNSFVLPQIVFEGKSLVHLWLDCCELKPQIIEEIRCHGLRELCLFQVCLDELMFQKIISNCPLIDYLAIDNCIGPVNIKVTKLQKLKRFSVLLKKSCSVEIEAPSLEDFWYRNIIDMDIEPIHRRLRMYASQNLKNLRLSRIDITDDFFLDITKKFPLLENLEISNSRNLQRIKISSLSINRVHLERNWGLKKVQIDVTGIDQFDYIGHFIPRLSFTPRSLPSVSHIELYCWQMDMLETSWFSTLRDFLMKLDQSKISLTIDFSQAMAGLIEDEIRNSVILLPLPRVQELTIRSYEKKYSHDANIILDGIFWACRPKTIVKSCYGEWYSNDELIKVLLEMLMFKMNQEHSNFQKTKLWQEDLKDVRLEMFRMGKKVQRPELMNWGLFSKISATDKGSWKFVFYLKWEH